MIENNFKYNFKKNADGHYTQDQIEQARTQLLEDMKKLASKDDGSFRYFVGADAYNAQQVIELHEKKTPLSTKFVEAFISGLEFFEKKPEQPKKKNLFQRIFKW